MTDNQDIPEDLVWEDDNPPNEWHYGLTGSGKSWYARTTYPDAYKKLNSKWFESYKGEPVILLEDLGMSHLYLGDHLKIWADKYGFRAEVKYASVVLRPEKIIVTSNYHPSELWPDKNVSDPILRRFKLVHYTESYKDRKVREEKEKERQQLTNTQLRPVEEDSYDYADENDKCLICYLHPCNCLDSQ